MAKMQINGPNDLMAELGKLGAEIDEIAAEALYAGAEIVADAIRKKLESLPEDTFRHLQKGEKFKGTPKEQRKDLEKSLGITKMGIDKRTGDYNIKVGFDGYGSMPTKKYPKGLPNPLLARSIESGSSVREKRPFVEPAVKKNKKTAIEAMQTVLDKHIKIITEKGGV